VDYPRGLASAKSGPAWECRKKEELEPEISDAHYNIGSGVQGVLSIGTIFFCSLLDLMGYYATDILWCSTRKFAL